MHNYKACYRSSYIKKCPKPLGHYLLLYYICKALTRTLLDLLYIVTELVQEYPTSKFKAFGRNE